jgi:quercetin dioxygenase-like cupin family protein/DNA-binding Xre family transcriptional regulator
VSIDPDHNVQPTLGERLREVRERRGNSLAEVSRATSISRSFLSLVENGKSDITIGRLTRLVRFYDIHVGDFLRGDDSGPPGVVRRAEQRHVPTAEGIDFYLLSPDADHEMLGMLAVFAPGARMAEMGRHPGEEVVHVLDGRIEVRLEGQAPVVLEPGDSITFSGEQGHLLSNVADDAARIIAVVTPPNL